MKPLPIKQGSSRSRKNDRSSSSSEARSSNGINVQGSSKSPPDNGDYYCLESPTLPTDEEEDAPESPIDSIFPTPFPKLNYHSQPSRNDNNSNNNNNYNQNHNPNHNHNSSSSSSSMRSSDSIEHQPNVSPRDRSRLLQSPPSYASPSNSASYQGLGPMARNSRGSSGDSAEQRRKNSPNMSRKAKHFSSDSSSPSPAEPEQSLAPAPGMYWSRASTHGANAPNPLRAHTVTLVGGTMFVFGGCDAKNCFSDLYILDLDTMFWSKPRIPGQNPPPCRAHSASMVEKRIYVFGGGDGPNYFDDLFVLDVETLDWSKPKASGTPPSPRRAHATCVFNNKVYIFGGGDGFRALNDVFVLDVSDHNNLKWSEMETHGTPPVNRGYHTSNLVGDKLVVYGGSDGHGCFSDVHVLDLATHTWHQMDLDRAVVPRLSHTATQVGSYLFIVGGHDGVRYSSEVLLLNLVTMNWETRRFYGSPPSGRGYHTTVLYDSRLFVFGGYDGKTVFDDVYVLDLSACAYLPQITNFKIEMNDA